MNTATIIITSLLVTIALVTAAILSAVDHTMRVLKDINTNSKKVRNIMRHSFLHEDTFVRDMLVTIEDEVPDYSFVGFFCEGKEYVIRKRDLRIIGSTLTIDDNPRMDCEENIDLRKVTRYVIYHNIQ